MLGDLKILAIVPARGGSKGLPGKNTMPVADKPLIAWSIEQARASRLVDDVVVSTDYEEIAVIARSYGANVPFLRPAELATDTASSIDVVAHALDRLADGGDRFDIVALIEPTSPLRETSDIDGALERLVATPGAESIVSVAAVESVHPAFLFREENGFLTSYTGRSAGGVRRQDLETLLFVEGSIYAAYTKSLRARGSFYHERTIGWYVPRYKAFEIDEMPDLIACEALLNARRDGRI
jgi:N-acylneuraminate cytidylyltransferase/CMP-N,N'-diacetyllegionaminic acid synthase